MINPIALESFQIEEVTIRSVRPYPLKRAFHDATMGPFDTFSFGTIVLKDADGTVGEVPFFTGAIPLFESIIWPRLATSRKLTHEELIFEFYWAIRNEGFRGLASAMLGQLDIAFYDIAAKRANQSLNRYLGATQDQAEVYASGGGTNLSADELVAEMTGFVQAGYTVLKMKVGQNFGRNMAQDVERVRLVRKAVGPDIQLAIDANQTWNATQALEFAHKIVDQHIAWFEEPVHSAALHEIEEYCARAPIPAAFGESERSGQVFPALVKAGVKHLQPIPGYLSTVSEYLEVIQLAKKNNLAFSSGGYSPLHCQFIAAANGNAITELLAPIIGSMDDYLALKPTIKNGHYLLPTEPGVSIRVDWDYIRKKDLLDVNRHWKI